MQPGLLYPSWTAAPLCNGVVAVCSSYCDRITLTADRYMVLGWMSPEVVPVKLNADADE